MWSVGADRLRAVAISLTFGVIAGCGGETASDPNAPPTSEQIARGAAVYQDVCSECHSLQPPPRLAPPLTHVGRMVKSQVDDRAAFTRHIVTYVQAPSEDRSLLPVQAIRRFGLMPAQVVTEHRLEDAAAWLWVMADSAQGGMDHDGEMGEGMGGMDHGPGMGEGMGRGMRGGGAAGDTSTARDTIR